MKRLRQEIPVKFYHIDAQNHISIPSLVNLLFEASGQHAENNGFGIDKIREQGISWIVGRIGIYLHAPLTRFEHLTVETWIDRTVGPSTLRKFNIFTPDNQLLGTACFTYAALDLETRQPINVLELIGTEISDLEYGKNISMPAKVRPAKTPYQLQQHATVAYSHLDYNQHATTTQYLKWITDAFDIEQHASQYISSIDINFATELLYGDKVSIHRAQTDSNTYTVELRTEVAMACRAKVVWEKK